MEPIRAQLMQAVIYPPTMLFVPVELAGMNITINVTMMLMGTALFNLVPAVWLFTAVAGHIAMIVAYSRDPHVVTLLRAYFLYPRERRNLVPCDDGIKYVP